MSFSDMPSTPHPDTVRILPLTIQLVTFQIAAFPVERELALLYRFRGISHGRVKRPALLVVDGTASASPIDIARPDTGAAMFPLVFGGVPEQMVLCSEGNGLKGYG